MRFRDFYHRLVFIFSINWTKTLYFNFKKFPFAVAKKCPIYFYGRVKFKNISGEIIINAPIQSGMIGFGQSYEIISSSKGTAELNLEGRIIFNGHTQFGKDYFIYIAPKASLQMGHMSSLGYSGKIICYEKIVMGDFARVGFESQLIDTNAHQMINTLTREKYPMTVPIHIGNYNYISNRVTILSNTITPDYCTIASNSLCLKDYTTFGQNILIGGVPAQLLRENISRDWSDEMAQLERWLKI
ncbi:MULTISPECIES: acyltransferase [Flavobacterium]|uniref:Transferase n=1 Tax=Flavobacterium sedimenticola TaxID=3043286 RepID=A0ABT6XTW7_9FLAO|nr:transferase [Flavobacterium sedimenticola]MDI9258257.1 transferase [Flavobacterium sedimenticola]